MRGKDLADKIQEGLKKEVGEMGQKPGLAIVIIGSRPDSATDVRIKKNVHVSM